MYGLHEEEHKSRTTGMWEKQSSVTCVAGLHRQEAKVTHNTGAFRPEALSHGFPAFPL